MNVPLRAADIKIVAGLFLLCSFFLPYAVSRSERYAEGTMLTTDGAEGLKRRAGEVRNFLSLHSEFNSDVAFFVDMRRSSRSYRFFVYNLKQRRIVEKGLVAHGIGSIVPFSTRLKFSNLPGSKCTSLGKYRVGAAYTGKFGKSYYLHGLEKTNSNAYARHVVLHSYKYLPEGETLIPIFLSEGCPMVSPGFFRKLEPVIDRSPKPILLCIYY